MMTIAFGAVGPDDVCLGRWAQDWTEPEHCLDENEVEAVVALESRGAPLYDVAEDGPPDGAPLLTGDIVWHLGDGWIGVARRCRPV